MGKDFWRDKNHCSCINSPMGNIIMDFNVIIINNINKSITHDF